jgi:hypothetical protein
MRWIAVLAALALAPSAAAAGTRTLTLYAYATQVRFADHADDRSRGILKNPFNADTKSLAPKTTGKGPQAGDSARFSFKLYSDAGLKRSAGSAVYNCTFNFAHHALCEALYELKTGTLFASGPTDFDTTRFTLAVTGGTSKFLGLRGQVSSAPAARNAHRLDFILR